MNSTSWLVCSTKSGAQLGIYEAVDARGALDAISVDAGYKDAADAAEQSGDIGDHLCVTPIQWLALGYGEESEVVARLPIGKWTVILDRDAAAVGASSCWFAIEAERDVAEAAYSATGGTVSGSALIEVKGK